MGKRGILFGNRKSELANGRTHKMVQTWVYVGCLYDAEKILFFYFKTERVFRAQCHISVNVTFQCKLPLSRALVTVFKSPTKKMPGVNSVREKRATTNFKPQ